MCRIPYADRIDGRYVFRRRIHFRNLISKPVTIALRTADPKAARRRAAMLSACFVIVKAKVERMLETGPALTGQQIDEIFRLALEEELNSLLDDAYKNAPWSDAVTDVAAEIAAACRNLRRPNRPLSPATSWREGPPDPGEYQHLDGADFYAAQILANLGDDRVAAILRAVGAPVHSGNLEPARTHIIRGMGRGAELAQRAFDDKICGAPVPAAALTAELGPRMVSAVQNVQPPMAVALTPTVPGEQDCQFLLHDKRRFSEIIEEVLAELKRKGIWKRDLSQSRRIMQTFAWITGDKMLGDYNHLDVAKFQNGILRLPKGFRFGTLTKGAMTRPFAEVVAKLPEPKDSQKRHLKTLNRDLSVMQTVSKHLEMGSWKGRHSEALVLNFGKSRVRIKRGGNARPPWTKGHIACLFQSPIYTGNDGALRRLKNDARNPVIWHDAAYFAPLIWYYSAACREEICGLELQDVILDHETPHFHIRDNLTRGRDGEKAGEKTEARNRLLPIPSEVMRLGFADYVRAIAKEKHVALFPELYATAEKRGGAFFYDRAWQHMVGYIADRMPLPEPINGKGADIHSLRSLFSSFYEVDGVNEILRADVMGHSRRGTNAENYSQRERTEGQEVILKERLEFMKRYVPEISKHLDPSPIRLLPLNQRSRVGSSRIRQVRSDAGKKQR
ncbi:hypothetical protein HL653_00270 [Sphingomonas sp. AP4-R1]|uniref:hypothetical protein n=1 Tax=Sphingomonas sp. AP4-R1 TaxID=2735134 RepID=UPI001493CA18|nr:hypothetical protein [Sphingomonas sp. AP4-R1]QJU56422.1 hypothetical protein HL653_00270 [Sphingomonas sp. AP4-R1]